MDEQTRGIDQMMQLYIKDRQSYYRAVVTRAWAIKHDNGALISCGLTVGEELTLGQLKALVARGQAVEVTKEEWNHSGCQSSCTLRGAKECRW